jgi:hypothetical protein
MGLGKKPNQSENMYEILSEISSEYLLSYKIGHCKKNFNQV